MTVLPPPVGPAWGHITPDVMKPKSLLPHATPFKTCGHSASDDSESDASGMECPSHASERELEREQESSEDTQVLGLGRDSAMQPLRKTSLVSQWTGAPIRAIIPLPRRKIAPNGTKGSVGAPGVVGPSPGGFMSWVGQPRVWDDVDSDSEDEGEEDDEDGPGRMGNGRAEYYCSYESITAVDGLTAWSFEELRVECYAQSLVARGTIPPPVVQPSLAIPPAFAPRIVRRELDPSLPVSCK